MTHATSPTIFREGEFIIVEIAGETTFSHGDQFTFEGRMYVFGPQWEGDTRGIWQVRDASGDWVAARNIRWVQWEPDPIRDQLTIPDKLAGRAAAVLPMMKTGTTPSAFSFHNDGLRFVRTVVFLEQDGEDGAIDIPLIDTDGRPWIGPEVPAMMSVRITGGTASDRVNDPAIVGVGWSDGGCHFRPGVATHNDLGYKHIHAYLKPAADPVPHWVLRITNWSTSGTSQVNVLVDLVGQGYGTHAATSREEGVSGTVGHWETSLLWTPQGFNATPSATAFNDRTMSMHALDVPNTAATPVFTSIYLTDDGTVTGADLFSELPLCDVLGDATIGSFNTATETSWENETWGLGVIDSLTDAVATEKQYHSSVSLEVTTLKFRLDIFNVGGRSNGTGTNDTAKDRSFRVYSIGKR